MTNHNVAGGDVPAYPGKPDWKDAPEWAKWLAMDGDGAWWWYSARPRGVKKQKRWGASQGSVRAERAYYDNNWLGTLESRPT